MKKLLEKLAKEYPDIDLGKHARDLLFITFCDAMNTIKRIRQRKDNYLEFGEDELESDR